MSVTIGKKGDIVIPKKAREAVQLTPGKSAVVTVHDGVIHIRPQRETPTEIMARWEARAKANPVSLTAQDIKRILDEDIMERNRVH